MSIDVAICGDRNVVKKDAEKISKYKDNMKTEIQRMWNVKAKLIPAITGATGTVSKSQKHHLSNITGEYEINALHNTAILRTVHRLREVLMGKYKTYSTDERTQHVAQTVNSVQLQQYIS